MLSFIFFFFLKIRGGGGGGGGLFFSLQTASHSPQGASMTKKKKILWGANC
jgi:hypothetical protein